MSQSQMQAMRHTGGEGSEIIWPPGVLNAPNARYTLVLAFRAHRNATVNRKRDLALSVVEVIVQEKMSVFFFLVVMCIVRKVDLKLEEKHTLAHT